MSGTTNDIDTGPDDAAMHPTSRKLLRTWERIRGERNAPDKSDMSMRELREILPWTCILHRDPVRFSYTFRLAGTAVCDIWGRQLTGSTAFHDWPNFDRETIVRGLDTVAGMKQPCVARFLAHSFGGREVGFELTAVPVMSADGTEVHALATIAPFRDRRGIQADPLVEFEIRCIRILWSDQLPGSAPAAVVSSNDDIRRLNTNFLRVIEGGKI
jgi:hypothetical protein